MTLRFLKLKQTGVYWPTDSGPDEFGKPVLGNPVEIDCRWEDVVEEFIAPDGTKKTSRAKIFVNEDLVVGGLIYLGTLADVEASGFPIHPKDADGVFDIKSFSKVPDLKAGSFVRVVYI